MMIMSNFGLVGFIVGYLMAIPFYTCILNIWLIFLNEPVLVFFLAIKWFYLFLSNKNTQLNNQTILLHTIQFSMRTQFVYTQSFVWIRFFCLHTVKCKKILIYAIQFSMSTKLNSSKFCYVSRTIQLNSHLFTHSQIIKEFYLKQFSLA